MLTTVLCVLMQNKRLEMLTTYSTLQRLSTTRRLSYLLQNEKQAMLAKVMLASFQDKKPVMLPTFLRALFQNKELVIITRVLSALSQNKKPVISTTILRPLSQNKKPKPEAIND